MPRSEVKGQASMFEPDVPTRSRVVNVASVPHRSPFRYPGGKTWFVPAARSWLRSQSSRPALLIEPFAGGAIVGLSAVFERLVDRLIIVERDPQVAAVWQCILEGGGDELCKRILSFEMNVENVKELLATSSNSVVVNAFQTIVRNRVNHGGILAPGAGLIKSGEAGKGLKSRWYAATLVARIRAIVDHRSRIDFLLDDGLKVLAGFVDHPSAVAFIDPPYTAGDRLSKRAGTRLYQFSQIDHRQLFEMCASFQGDVVMTYDNDQAVRQLARQYALAAKAISMKNTHHITMDELVIGKKLDWLE